MHQPRPAIDVGPDGIRVIDPNSNALIASVSNAQVTATPVFFRPVQRHWVPSLAHAISDAATNYWSTVPAEDARADYEVSGTDWLTLVEKFGLAPYLITRGKRALLSCEAGRTNRRTGHTYYTVNWGQGNVSLTIWDGENPPPDNRGPVGPCSLLDTRGCGR